MSRRSIPPIRLTNMAIARFRDARVVQGPDADLDAWRRQISTASVILQRLRRTRGQLLADDAGMGKTLTSLLVAFVFIAAGRRVAILAPNPAVREAWLQNYRRLGGWLGLPERSSRGEPGLDAMSDLLRKTMDGRILLTTHGRGLQRSSLQCDLLIVDEAHRSKGKETKFRKFLSDIATKGQVGHVLYVTATPMSIGIGELTAMLELCQAEQQDIDAVVAFDRRLERLWSGLPIADPGAEAAAIEQDRTKAIVSLRRHVVRHTIAEQDQQATTYGRILRQDAGALIHADPLSAGVLMRTDRAFRLAKQLRRAAGVRSRNITNDARFHVGKNLLEEELAGLVQDAGRRSGPAWGMVARLARDALRDSRRRDFHPKVDAVAETVADIVERGHKVLLFAHHHDTAREIARAIARACRTRIGCDQPTQAEQRAMCRALDLDHPNISRCHPFRVLGHAAISGPAGAWFAHRVRLGRKPGMAASASFDTPADPAIWGSRRRFRAMLSSFSTEVVGRRDDNPHGSVAKILRDATTARRRVMPNAWVMLMSEGWKTQGMAERLGIWQQARRPDMAMLWFNSPFGPPVLVATDRLSEGVDLHRHCRHLVHYEMPPSPVRMIQRRGRLRRLGSLAAQVARATGSDTAEILEFCPYFSGTRDEAAVRILGQRLQRFDDLLGGVGARITELHELPAGVDRVLELIKPPRLALAIIKGRGR
jgi:hypothetical protein